MMDAVDAKFEAWVQTLPAGVQPAARAYPATQHYTIIETGQTAQIEAYEEGDDGGCSTVRVTAWQEWLPAFTARGVFGVALTSLRPVVLDGGR